MYLSLLVDLRPHVRIHLDVSFDNETIKFIISVLKNGNFRCLIVSLQQIQKESQTVGKRHTINIFLDRINST